MTDASPSGYNDTYTVTGTPTSTKFTVANAVNPGTWVSGGTIKRVSTLTAQDPHPDYRNVLEQYRSSIITYATATSHNLVVGDVITVTGASPSGYNGTYTVTSTPTSYTFTVAQASNPGAWTSGGTFTSGRFWSGGVITFTSTANHNYSVGTVVVVSGASPASYDGTYTVTAVPSSTTFSVAQAVSPGNWISGGTVTPGFRRTLIVSVEAAFNSLGANTDAGGGLVLGFLPTRRLLGKCELAGRHFAHAVVVDNERILFLRHDYLHHFRPNSVRDRKPGERERHVELELQRD